MSTCYAFTKLSFPHSWLITGFVTRLTGRVSLVEQELLTLPEHLSSPPVFSGVRVTRSLVLCVCFGDRCLSFCTFYFGHCVVCSSSIYGFWLPLWYLQSLLIYQSNHKQIIAPEYHTLHVIYQSNHKQIIAPEYHTLYMLYISRIINRLLLQDITHYMLYISLIINRLLLQNITHYTCCISVES
jgi:hypothetical protein